MQYLIHLSKMKVIRIPVGVINGYFTLELQDYTPRKGNKTREEYHIFYKIY